MKAKEWRQKGKQRRMGIYRKPEYKCFYAAIKLASSVRSFLKFCQIAPEIYNEDIVHDITRKETVVRYGLWHQTLLRTLCQLHLL